MEIKAETVSELQSFRASEPRHTEDKKEKKKTKGKLKTPGKMLLCVVDSSLSPVTDLCWPGHCLGSQVRRWNLEELRGLQEAETSQPDKDAENFVLTRELHLPEGLNPAVLHPDRTLHVHQEPWQRRRLRGSFIRRMTEEKQEEDTREHRGQRRTRGCC